MFLNLLSQFWAKHLLFWINFARSELFMSWGNLYAKNFKAAKEFQWNVSRFTVEGKSLVESWVLREIPRNKSQKFSSQAVWILPFHVTSKTLNRMPSNSSTRIKRSHLITEQYELFVVHTWGVKARSEMKNPQRFSQKHLPQQRSLLNLFLINFAHNAEMQFTSWNIYGR